MPRFVLPMFSGCSSLQLHGPGLSLTGLGINVHSQNSGSRVVSAILTPIIESSTTWGHKWSCILKRGAELRNREPSSWWSREDDWAFFGWAFVSTAKLGPRSSASGPQTGLAGSRKECRPQKRHMIYERWRGKYEGGDSCTRRERRGNGGLSGGCELLQLSWVWSASPSTVFSE